MYTLEDGHKKRSSKPGKEVNQFTDLFFKPDLQKTRVLMMIIINISYYMILSTILISRRLNTYMKYVFYRKMALKIVCTYIVGTPIRPQSFQ